MPQRPLLFCLHALGGSRRSWSLVADALRSSVDCRPLDLPGFGDAAAAGPADVAAMRDAVSNGIAAHLATSPGTPWALAGHSMGAKVALAVARAAVDAGQPPSHLILVAGSPPAPEPIEDARRAEMLTWFQAVPKGSDSGGVPGKHEADAHAAEFIDANTAQPLPSMLKASAVSDALRMNPAAWRAWLTSGSREDWQARIGRLDLPALILAGAADPELGVEAQRRLMAPHLPRHRLETLGGCRHLLPLERPAEVAQMISKHLLMMPPRL